MTAFLTVADKLITLFIYVIVGYIVCKRKIIPWEFCQNISRFLTMVTLPCLVLMIFQTSYDATLLHEAGEVYLISLVILGLSLILGHLTSRLFKISPAADSVWVYSVAFPNHSFMGWPVMAALFAGHSLFYAAFANLAFCTYAYTYGVYLMEKTGTKKASITMKERLLTPINFAIVIGIIMFVNQWQLPSSIYTAVNGFAGLTTPMAMFYVGSILSQTSLKETILDPRGYLCAAMRLIVIPLLIYLFARPFTSNPVIFGVLVIGHAMPVAGFCAIFAGEAGNDVALASRFISITTLLSLITIPIFSLFV